MQKYETDEKNKIKHSVMCCVYCGKSYKKRINLEKHIILCEISHDSKRSSSHSNNNNDYDTDNLIQQNISSKKLYQIVIQLSIKCNRLENKLADLSKYVTKKIQKINIIDYLNNNTRTTNYPTLLFENITEIINVEQSDIEYLFHNSFMDTVNTILSRNIYDNNSKNELPIASFKEKKNTIYVYSKNNNDDQNNNQTQNPTWAIVTRESLIRFLNIIQFKISKAFSEWRKNNSQLLNDNDNHSILYDKTFSKLMEPDFKIEKTFVKFYNNIYKGNLGSPLTPPYY
jgi:hypothetical protein